MLANYDFGLLLAMPARMCIFACSQMQERSCACLKYFQTPITIVVGGMDVDIRLLVILKKLILD